MNVLTKYELELRARQVLAVDGRDGEEMVDNPYYSPAQLGDFYQQKQVKLYEIVAQELMILDVRMQALGYTKSNR